MTVHFGNVSELRRSFASAGSFYFSPDTLKYFRSKIYNELYAGRVFLSSEKQDDDSPRRYSVCLAEVDPATGHHSIAKIGGFQAFGTLQQARLFGGIVGRLVSAGLIPDMLAYGMDAALSLAMGLSTDDGTDGWFFDEHSGFSKEDAS